MSRGAEPKLIKLELDLLDINLFNMFETLISLSLEFRNENEHKPTSLVAQYVEPSLRSKYEIGCGS